MNKNARKRIECSLSMMEYTINNSAPEEEKTIITKCLEVKDGKLVNTQKKVFETCENTLSNYTKITSIIRNNVSFSFYSPCYSCESVMKITTIPDYRSIRKLRLSDFKDNRYYIDTPLECSECKEKRKERADKESERLRKLDVYETHIETCLFTTKERFDYAMDNEIHSLLDTNHTFILKTLLYHTHPKLAFKRLLNKQYHEKTVWNVINKLEGLGLIKLNRDNNLSIHGFEYPENLHLVLKVDKPKTIYESNKELNPNSIISLSDEGITIEGTDTSYIISATIGPKNEIELKIKPSNTVKQIKHIIESIY